MDKLRGWLPRNRLLFLRNFLVVLVLLLVFSCAIVYGYQKQIQHMIISDIELLNLSNLEQNIQTMDGVMLNLRGLTYSASKNISDFFQGSLENATLIRRAGESAVRATETLNRYVSADAYADMIYAYSLRTDQLISSTNRDIGDSVLMNDDWRSVSDGLNSAKVRVFFQRRNGVYPYLLTLIQAVHTAGNEKIGYMMVDVDVEKLGAVILGKFPDNFSNRLFIVNAQGQMLLSTPYRMLGERDSLPDTLAFLLEAEAGHSQIVQIDGVEYVVSCQDSTQENWRYILARPYDHYITLSIRGELVFSMMLTIVLALVLLVVVSIVLITNRPLDRIITAIESTAPQVKMNKGMQEVEKVIQSVYNLHSENTSMRKQLDEKMQQFDMEQVRALQHQMDPHFLYNVLDYFRWISIDELGEGNALEGMARTLSDFFRVALKRSDYLVPLKDELRHVELFMQLYAYRYQGRLNIQYDVPDELLEKRVLKLSVQPIIDNAIKHGLRPRRYMGNIWIRARLEDDALLILVENDGDQMPEEELRQINEKLRQAESNNLDEHIGLPNIARRIRLLFGAEYGLTLQNNENGMVVVMRLPANTYSGTERTQE